MPLNKKKKTNKFNFIFRTAYIVTELMDTTLFQLLRDKRDLSFEVKLKVAIDIAEGMQFLHSRDIIHRDLKSVNVLLSSGPDYVAKVLY